MVSRIGIVKNVRRRRPLDGFTAICEDRLTCAAHAADTEPGTSESQVA